MNKNKKGFTLVELLVGIAIIGILAIVAVPALFKNIEKGKIADLEGDISAIRSASLSHYADESKYPKYDEIVDDIEGISNPFDANYELVGDVPEDLILKISFGEKKPSKSGFDKLENDLGDRVEYSIKKDGSLSARDDDYCQDNHESELKECIDENGCAIEDGYECVDENDWECCNFQCEKCDDSYRDEECIHFEGTICIGCKKDGIGECEGEINEEPCNCNIEVDYDCEEWRCCEGKEVEEEYKCKCCKGLDEGGENPNPDLEDPENIGIIIIEGNENR